ncbi:hypothetical protein PAXRUDRAFT_14727 [Paxillus rubicundulus Ve08.2h10]|uniref:Uncharacterized protein n=1 Tax=Paxillus rubicundulus Ve08.2h10 TaxID=930991 RepID=A0A0D0D359_9AGAM|nr:hypothetical protein PAXRUDRAFT_14727 [Paxillus rubicundulus Ve08.2h10]
MSFRNTTLARIMQMGDKIMLQPPDFKLAKALPKGLGQEVQPGWVNMWMLTVEILFMFAWHAEGLGYKARMLMRNAKESHGTTGGREWEVLIDKELANLKVSMDAMLGETEEAEGLLDCKLVHPESKWCSWCYTEAHWELV